MSQQTEMEQFKRGIRMIFWCLIALSGGGGTGALASDGGLSISHTRVIFEGDRKSEKVTVTNHSGRVYLINSRVISSPEATSGGSDFLAFMITPPIFRLESGSRNAVLVVRNNTSALPTDRESVFYLSFLAIPAVTKPRDNSADDVIQPLVSVGIRSVIKLFYRPSGLGMTAVAAPAKLRFTLRDGGLHAENPTPYYLTLARLQVDGRVIDVHAQGSMIPPYAGCDYRIKGNAGEVNWSVIDDYGGVSRTYRQAVLRGK